jgi:chromosome segregation ATPase
VRDADTVALTQELREFTRATKEKEAQLEKERQKLEDRKTEYAALVAARSDLQSRLGGLKHARDEHMKAIADRDRKVAEVAGTLNIPGWVQLEHRIARVIRRRERVVWWVTTEGVRVSLQL